MSALSIKQKVYLAQLALRAFHREGAQARGAGANANPQSAHNLQAALASLAAEGSNKAFEEWRHQQVARACGKQGLRCCSQLDYKTVEAHFLHLLGEDGRALNALVRAEEEPRRQAEAVLVKTCLKWGFQLAYADALCRGIHKMPLNDAPPQIIWQVVYTVENRGRIKARKEKEMA